MIGYNYKRTHKHIVNQGSTLEESFRNTLTHFITFIIRDNMMWELDGRLEGPNNLRYLTQGETLEVEASKVIESYIEKSNVM